MCGFDEIRGVIMIGVSSLRHTSELIRSAFRREFEETVDPWTQTKFIGGLILLAAVISLLFTSDLRWRSHSVLAGGPQPMSAVHDSKSSPADCGQTYKGQ